MADEEKIIDIDVADDDTNKNGGRGGGGEQLSPSSVEEGTESIVDEDDEDDKDTNDDDNKNKDGSSSTNTDATPQSSQPQQRHSPSVSSPTEPPISIQYYQLTEKLYHEIVSEVSEHYNEFVESAGERVTKIRQGVTSSLESSTFITTIQERAQIPSDLQIKSQKIMESAFSKVSTTFEQPISASKQVWNMTTTSLPSTIIPSLSPVAAPLVALSSSLSSSELLPVPVPIWMQGIVVGTIVILILRWTFRRIFGTSSVSRLHLNSSADNSTTNGSFRTTTKGGGIRNKKKTSFRRSSVSFRPKKSGALLHHSGGQLKFEASGKLNAEEGVAPGTTTGMGIAAAVTRSFTSSFLGGGSRDRIPSSSDHVGGGSASLEILGGRRGRFNTFDFFGMNQAHNQQRYRRTGSGGPPAGGGLGRDHLSSSFHSTSQRRRASSSGGGGGGGGVASGQRSRANSQNYHRERLGSMDLYYGPAGRGGGRGTFGGAHVSDLTGGGAAAAARLRRTNSFPNERGDTPVSQDSRGFSIPGEPSLNSPSAYDGISEGFASLPGGADSCLYDEFGVVALSHRVEYFGPEKRSIDFETMTPPVSWQAASRRIVPTSIISKLQRTMKIDCSTGQLHVTEPTSGGRYDFSLPMSSISIHVHQPLEGAVVSLYVKGSPKEEWMEHTFESAHAAAQFQLDMLAFQTIGDTLRHIFEALNLIHLGSLAYEGQEFVLHDYDKDESDDGSKQRWSRNCANCVSWDDAMRAMSSIPTIRIALERLWLTHRHPRSITPYHRKNRKKSKSPVSAATAVAALDIEQDAKETTNLGVISEEYAGKRLLLGPIDFFRLFVPTLPETAIPEDESNRNRMEQLLSWRKRAARAAVLVRSYSRARRVVNIGWKLIDTGQQKEEPQSSLVHRLAYDGNEDNNVRDTVAKNEIYEASVSRDVLCYVRPYGFLSEDDERNIHYNFDKDLVLSPFQGYSHINTKWFNVTPDLIQQGGPMHVDRDPIDIFPSLRQLAVANPDLDFIFLTIIHPALSITLTHVFVRSLAKGVDPQFDNVVERFSRGDKESRDRKLLLLFQLGNRMGLSFFGWLIFRLMSFLFQFTSTGRDSPVILESTRDRYAFPAFKVGKMFHTSHFGGSLQKDPSKPQNYFAVSTNLGTFATTNSIFLSMMARVQRHISDSIVDFTHLIEGEHEDELPERALTSVRQVHVNPKEVAIDPLPFIDTNVQARTRMKRHEGRIGDASSGDRPSLGEDGRLNSTYYSILDTLQSFTGGGAGSRTAEHVLLMPEDEPQDKSNALESPRAREDHIDKSEEEVREILGSIKVPTRLKPELLNNFGTEAVGEQSEETGTMVLSLVPVLQLIGPSDIQSYIRESNFEVQEASVKIVETAAWRGRTFPIDKRRCRIELQNGQFFHQGIDLDNNPVFYIRYLARGPWRSDEDASVLAMLYRFDKCLHEYTKINPSAKITIVILMGLPKKKKKDIDRMMDENDGNFTRRSKDGHDDETTDPGDAGTAASSIEDGDEVYPPSISNPRISSQENWKMHMNRDVMGRLIEILRKYYVGRLSRIVLVHGRGKSWYYQTRIEHRVRLKKILQETPIPDDIFFADKTIELCKYVDREQLSVLVGGTAPVPELAFEY